MIDSMEPEPEKRIDQWLKQWAAQRRQASAKPFELHPATREMLMSEVRRVHHKSLQANNEPSLWWWLFRRLAWAGSGMAVFILLAMVVLPHLHPDKTASNEAPKQGATSSMAVNQSPALRSKGDAPKVILAGRPPNAPVVLQETHEQPVLAKSADKQPQMVERAERARTLLTKAMTPSQEQTIMARPATPSMDSLVQSLPVERKSKGVATKAPAAMAYRVPQEGTAISGAESVRTPTGATSSIRHEQFVLVKSPGSNNGTAGERMSFGLAATPKANTKATIDTLLAKFSLEQEGTTVKIIGADNSVYAGQWNGGTSPFTATGTHLGSGQRITIKAQWLLTKDALGVAGAEKLRDAHNALDTIASGGASNVTSGLAGSEQATRLSGWLILEGQTNAFEAVSETR